MARVLFFIALILLALYCIVELAQSPKYRVRAMPKWLWFVAICVPGIGGICWLLFGRPVKSSQPRPGRGRAPDDDPDFLRKLK